MNRRLAALALVATSVLAGCTAADDEAVDADSGDEVETLTACVAATPQLVEPDPQLQFVGFDIAVLEHVATSLGRELEFVEVSFDELVSGVALNGMRCEIGAGGVVEHEGLDAVVTTSEPYRAIDRVVITVGEAEAVAPEEVVGPVGYVEGGVAADGVDALVGAELVPYPSLTDLERGIGTSEQPAWLVTVDEREQLSASLAVELDVVTRAPSGERTVLLLPLGADEALVEGVDDALSGFQASPVYAQLRARWLDG